MTGLSQNSVYISGEKVAQFKADPKCIQCKYSFRYYRMNGNRKADGRWWYRRADGTYPANKWEELGGKWYFFDENGLYEDRLDRLGRKELLTALKNGDMLTNCMTPDNYLVGEDGAWIAQ